MTAPPPDDSPPSAEPTPLPRLAYVAVASALFMEFIDSSALSTALPTLATAFRVDPVHLKLALTSYILALAVFVPLSGWVAERFQPRRVFLLAMAVFLLGSALCGLSRSLPELVAARIVQGIGGALMTPVARLIVVGSAPRSDLIRAMGWFTMPALVGPIVGPPLAGLVLQVADWPWIFFLNLPVGLLGMAAVLRLVPRMESDHPGPFDWSGFLLAAAAISGLVVVAETSGLAVLPGSLRLALLIGAILAGWVYIRRRGPARPILDLALLRYRTYRASLLGGTLVRLGVGASPFLMPLLLQVGLGWTPLQAGGVTFVGGLGVFCARPAAAPMLRRWGFRPVLLAFGAATALFTALPGLMFRPETPKLAIMAVLLFAGFARSSQFIAANTIAYADVPQASIAPASTLAFVTQQIGLALGVSFGGLMLHLARSGGEALTPDRFILPYLAIGATTLLSALAYIRLDRDAGASISGARAGG